MLGNNEGYTLQVKNIRKKNVCLSVHISVRVVGVCHRVLTIYQVHVRALLDTENLVAYNT